MRRQGLGGLEAKVLQSKDPTARADAPALESLGETDVRGFVEIESEPAGATIYLDDRREGPLGTTPWNGELVGPHKLILLAPGYDDLETPITGDRRRITRLHLVLSRQQYLGWLEVRSNVAGADVYLDGRQGGAVGRTPYLANVTPGKHMLVVAKEGFTEERKMITIVAGKVHKLDLTLDKAPIGYVSIGGISVDGAAVKLDGKLVCSGAPCRFQSPDGEHRIEVAKPGLKTYERKIAIGRATETEITAIVATVNLLSERGPPSVGSVDRHDLGAPSASARWLPSVSPVLARSYAGVAASVSW